MPSRDVFNSLREKLKLSNSRLRQAGADYLCYTMLDLIVDHYFIVMENLGDQIEDLGRRSGEKLNTAIIGKN